MRKQSPSPIGLSFPLSRGTQGYFAQTFDNVSQARASILNLLNTRPGERPLNPLFGSRIYNYVFEQEVDQSMIQQIIQEEVTFWIPSVTVQSVDITLSDTDIDNYIMYIQVDYTTGNVTGSTQLAINL